MTATIVESEQHTAVTRASLLHGIQQGKDDRWHEFFQTYGPIIRGFALKAGLTETEADEVVQETCIGVAKNVGEFHYDPQKCRFKTWLLNLASWRVKNQFTKRERWDGRVHGTVETSNDATQTAMIEKVPDLNTSRLDAIWDEQWREDLLKAALQKVRTEFNATHFQIFDLTVLKEWSAGDTAKALGVSLPAIHLAKHRVSTALKKEIARLDRAFR